jgi:hypothetical protein
MVHSLLAAWRVSLHRTRADWPIVAAAALISLLAATLLAAGPIYSSAVSEAGLHRLLASAPTTEANLEIVARVTPERASEANSIVGEQLRRAVGAAGVEVVASGTSDSFALPGQDPGEVRDLATVAFQQGVEEHATLVSGAWPVRVDPGSPVQLAVLEPVAATLGLAVGDPLALVSRLDPDVTVDAVVTAVYRPTDPGEPFWWNDPTLVDGLVESEQYRTFGPLLTTPEDLLGRASRSSARLVWHAFPRIEGLTIGDVAALRSRIEQLPARLEAALPGEYASSATGLPDLLADSEQALLASRTGVLLLLAQLAVLAGYAIALTADLIVDHRRLDTALLRSRGASTAQVGVLALAEALLLALPAGMVGPWLAALALRLFNVAGPLAGIGLEIDPVITGDAYLAAAGAALGCALLLVLPAFLAARSYAAERSGRARPGTRTLGQRVGLDIALLAVTAVGLWQLRLYGSPLTTSVHGSLGLDPLLVAAPAIGILAGSVVALRIVPLLAHAADRLASRGRTLVASLGARQLARRPLRYTRTALLLMLAMSMGVFSVSYATTWTGSQRDQADFQVGADVRIAPARGLDALPGWAIDTVYGSIAGVARRMPVARDGLRVTPSAGNGELIALDAADAAQVVTLREDAAGGDVAALAGALVEARPTVAAVELPGEPQRLAIDAVLALDEVGAFVPDTGNGEPGTLPEEPAAIAAVSSVVAMATVRDARGLLHRFVGPEEGLALGPQRFVVALAADTTGRQATTERLGGSLAFPLELVGVEVLVSLPQGIRATEGRLALEAVASSETADGEAWQALDLDVAGAWALGWSEAGQPPVAVPGDLLSGRGLELGSGGAGAGAGFRSLPGVDRFGRGVTLSFLPAAIGGLADAEIAAIVNRPFVEAVAAATGDRVIVPLPGGSRALRIVGTVESFPTTDPARPAAIVDLPSLALARFGADRSVGTADEWWLDVDDAAHDAVLAERSGGRLAGATVTSRVETRERLSTDPLALATIGALSLGFVVAGLFAVIGLAVSAAVSARQRRTEFALLRALGLSPDQLSGWLWLENASLVIVSLVAGTGLGLLIGWVVLPFITVTQEAAVPFPPVLVEVPWTSIVLLEAVSVAALAATLLVLARWMQRAGVGSVLRMGED